MNLAYNSSDDKEQIPYLDITKLVKCFIGKHKYYLPLFENDIDIMFNDLFCESICNCKTLDIKISQLSTFIFMVLKQYCIRLHRKQNVQKRQSNFNTLNIDDCYDLQSNINIEAEYEINSILKLCPKIIIEYYIEGYNQYELANLYNTTQANIGSRLKQELTKIRHLIELGD